MSDLIDRQAAIDVLDVLCQEHRYRIPGKSETYRPYNEAWQDALDMAECAIGKLPSVHPTYTDAEVQKIQDMEQAEIEKAFDLGREDALSEITHCKDCKYWMPYDWMFSEVWQSKNMDDYPEKEIGCQYCDMNMGANDFCSRSERRTDGEIIPE